MKKFNVATVLRRLWIRTTLASIAALLVTLLVVVGAVYQLTILNEHRDIDALLTREGTTVSLQISDEVTALTEQRQLEIPAGVVTVSDIQTIASRALAVHPGSSLHMTVIRFGDTVLTSARGPERLEGLRDQDLLPTVTPGVVRSQEGIRSRSQDITFANLRVTVETIGDDQAVVNDARTIAGRVLLAAIIGGVLGTAGLVIAVRQSTKSLDAVSHTVRRTRLDDLSARVPDTDGTGEVAVLARDVNAMLDDLAVSRSAREEFIASVSHELRTPLAAARGHTDLLKDHRADNQDLTVARIDRELSRMTRLVDDLLALSRAADPAWLSKKLVRTQFILDELEGRIAAFTTDHITIQVGPDVMIEVDADRILQALSNLVRNAVLHTPEGTTIEVWAHVDEDSVSFVVSDNGPGVSPEVLANFGEAFVRGSETGTGLGLAVSRAVAAAHKGSLTVQSASSGTAVTLSIPVE